MAMKVVRQAQLELSGGSTPDQLRPPEADQHTHSPDVPANLPLTDANPRGDSSVYPLRGSRPHALSVLPVGGMYCTPGTITSSANSPAGRASTVLTACTVSDGYSTDASSEAGVIPFITTPRPYVNELVVIQLASGYLPSTGKHQVAHRTPNHVAAQVESALPPSALPCARTLFCDEQNATVDHSEHMGTDSDTHYVNTSTADTTSMRSGSTEDVSSSEQLSVCSMDADSSPASNLDSDMYAYLSCASSGRTSMSCDTSAIDSDIGSYCCTPVCYDLMCTDEGAPPKHEGAGPSAPSHHRYNPDRFTDAPTSTQSPGR